MKRWKLFLPLISFLVLCGLLLRGLFMEDKNVLPSALLDKPMPGFSLPTLKDPVRTVTQEGLLGEVYLLNVWGSWCPACTAEHPYLSSLAHSGIRIIGLNYKDERGAALRWLNRLGDGYIFHIVDVDGRLGLDLGVYGSPETFLVDKNGIIRFKHVGIVNKNVWEDELKPLYESLQEEPVQ